MLPSMSSAGEEPPVSPLAARPMDADPPTPPEVIPIVMEDQGGSRVVQLSPPLVVLCMTLSP